MVPIERLHQITQRFEFLEAQMAEGSGDIAALAKEYSDLKPVVEQVQAYHKILSDIEEAEEMLSDPDMKDLAEEELALSCESRTTVPRCPNRRPWVCVAALEASGRLPIFYLFRTFKACV